jgi:lipoprotein-releasing system permease protein
MAQSGHKTPKPFAGFEFLIAWRYLRARRAEGGVSVMTWISFLGVALAVAALIATLAVRSGFRYEFVGTILGANPHMSVYVAATVLENGQLDRSVSNYAEIAEAVAVVDGVVHAAPYRDGAGHGHGQ